MRASPYLSVGVSSARLNSCSVTPFAPLPPSTLEILPEKYFSRSAPHGSRTINTLRPLPPPPPPPSQKIVLLLLLLSLASEMKVTRRLRVPLGTSG